MNKLILIFNDDSQVNNVPVALVFNNELDAIDFLKLNGIKDVEFDFIAKHFSFRTDIWRGYGKAHWAIDKSVAKINVVVEKEEEVKRFGPLGL